jgi:hypothetical protein
LAVGQSLPEGLPFRGGKQGREAVLDNDRSLSEVGLQKRKVVSGQPTGVEGEIGDGHDLRFSGFPNQPRIGLRIWRHDNGEYILGAGLIKAFD